MSAVLEIESEHDRPHATLPPSTLALLNRIRFAAALCRSSARLDLFEACALLDREADGAEEVHIATLIRVMGQALDARPVFRRPGEIELSFDEAWLVAAISARLDGDEDSFAFLVGRRVAASKRRTLSMLVSGLVAILKQSAHNPTLKNTHA